MKKAKILIYMLIVLLIVSVVVARSDRNYLITNNFIVSNSSNNNSCLWWNDSGITTSDNSIAVNGRSTFNNDASFGNFDFQNINGQKIVTYNSINFEKSMFGFGGIADYPIQVVSDNSDKAIAIQEKGGIQTEKFFLGVDSYGNFQIFNDNGFYAIKILDNDNKVLVSNGGIDSVGNIHSSGDITSSGSIHSVGRDNYASLAGSSFSASIETTDRDVTLGKKSYTLLVSCDKDITVTLPDINKNVEGFIYNIKLISQDKSGTCCTNIIPVNHELIDGQSSYSICRKYGSVMIQGTNNNQAVGWWILAKK